MWLTWQDRGLKAVDYQQQIVKRLPSMMADMWLANGLFMQDNAPSHTARTTMQRIDELGIKMFPPGAERWPANSPDLNPVENVWAWVKQQLNQLPVCPATPELMKRAVNKIWAQLTPDMCRKYIDNYPRRLKAVLEAQGRHTVY